MALDHSAYSRRTRAALKVLPRERLSFLTAWVCEDLDRRHGHALDERGHSAEHARITDAIALLWRNVDDPDAVDSAELSRTLRAVRSIDIDDLDYARIDDCGVLSLMEAVEAALSLEVKGDLGAAVTALWMPVQVLNTIKADGSLRETSDAIDDPFFAQELAVQKAVIDALRAGADLRSTDRAIHRS